MQRTDLIDLIWPIYLVYTGHTLIILSICIILYSVFLQICGEKCGTMWHPDSDFFGTRINMVRLIAKGDQ